MFALACGPGRAEAVQSLRLEIGEVAWDGGHAQGIALELRPGAIADSASGRLEVTSLRGAEGLAEARALALDCPEMMLTNDRLRCARGRIAIDYPALDTRRAEFSLDWRTTGSIGLMQVTGFSFAGARASLKLETSPAAWDADVMAKGLRPERITGPLRERLFARTGLASLSGQADFVLKVHGRPAGDMRLDLMLDAREVALADVSGRLAGERLGGRLRVKGAGRGSAWETDVRLDQTAGELYADPVYLDLKGAPFTLNGKIAFGPEAGRVRLRALSIAHDRAARATLDADLRLDAAGAAGIESAALRLHEGRFPGLYETWLKPFLIGTPLDDLDTEGRLSGSVELRRGRPTLVDLVIDDLYAHDRRGRLGLSGVEGRAGWRSDGRPGTVAIDFAGGHFARIQVGPSRMRAVTAGDRMELTEPAVIPVFDGRLEVDSFRLAGIASQSVSWSLGGRLTPIEMERLSAALGWPRLSGTLSGGIEEIRYEGGVVTIGGALALYVFDGTTIVRNLRLEEPLGAAPVLTADVDIRGLDLDLITRTFEFGRIQGRLDGHVHDLVLAGWQPARFDAALYTPEGDRSRRRISQKAVDNISRVGGGFTGALSSGFLRFFEEFSYGRLGLTCRLEGEVCRMGGIGPADGGYYIVKGAGLPPRIDVIGFTREVAWRDLLTRIKDSIRDGQGPIIR